MDEALQAACEADDDMNERVVAWALARATLGPLTGEEEDEGEENGAEAAPTLESLVSLLEREWSAKSGCCGFSRGEPLLRILLYRAEHSQRRFEEAADFAAADRHWLSGLHDLRSAAWLVSATESPARWRRYAEAWLRLWTLGGRRTPPAGTLPMTAPPELQRYATYLRTVLPRIQTIAVGADAGLSAAR